MPVGDVSDLLDGYHGVLPAQQQCPHVLHGPMERPRHPAQRGEVGWAVIELADELDHITDVPQGSHVCSLRDNTGSMTRDKGTFAT
jgi:hypothetical protein